MCPYEKNITNPRETINPDFILFFNTKPNTIQITNVKMSTIDRGKTISSVSMPSFWKNKKMIGKIENKNGWTTIDFVNFKWLKDIFTLFN